MNGVKFSRSTQLAPLSPARIASASVDTVPVIDGLTITAWTHENIDDLDEKLPVNFLSEYDDHKPQAADISTRKSPSRLSPIGKLSAIMTETFRSAKALSPYSTSEKIRSVSKGSLELFHDESDDRESFYHSRSRRVGDHEALFSTILEESSILPRPSSSHWEELWTGSSQAEFKASSPVTSHPLNTFDPSHAFHMNFMWETFGNDSSSSFLNINLFLCIYCAAMEVPSIGIIAAAMEVEPSSLMNLVETSPLIKIFTLPSSSSDPLHCLPQLTSLKHWLTSSARIGQEFWLDVKRGHNYLCCLHLKYCGNKSVAVECPWQDYLRMHGQYHLRQSSRELIHITQNIRKIDETVGFKDTLPPQIGFIAGLQEIYARRVGSYFLLLL